MTAMTTLKVPVPLRDRIRDRAQELHVTQAQVLEDLLARAEQESRLAELAAWEPDEDYLREMRGWDQADLAPGLDEYPA